MKVTIVRFQATLGFSGIDDDDDGSQHKWFKHTCSDDDSTRSLSSARRRLQMPMEVASTLMVGM